MTYVIQKCFSLVVDFISYTLGMFQDRMQCDLVLAVCSALACVACIRLFWRLFD